MNFYIQDPTYPASYSLHEALLQACEGAIRGGGTYAFVSKGGVKLFLEDVAFARFISIGSFNLVVGIDAITSVSALTELSSLKQIYQDKLEAHAFFHDTKGSLFHPKFSWFKNDSGGVLVLGSGNLTVKGLRKNREAFTVIKVDEAKINEIEENWNNWLDHNVDYLKLIEAEDVIDRVKENAIIFSISKNKTKTEDKAEEAKDEEEEDEEEEEETEEDIEDIEDLEAWSFAKEDSIYVREIPDNNKRWKQANFDKASFVNFFGGQPGNHNLRILLRSVLSDGSLGSVEVRPYVAVKSKNYRIELKAASGKKYPDPLYGRPIGIFVRLSTRMFLYVLAMPTDVVYHEVRLFLDQHYSGRKDRMKSYHTSVQELKTECPNLSLWHNLV